MSAIAEIERRIAADRPPPPGDDLSEALRPETLDDESPQPAWDAAADATLVADDDAPQGGPFEVHRDSQSDSATEYSTGIEEPPAVVIPPTSFERPSIRREVPTPLGSPHEPPTEIPLPIGSETQPSWTPTPMAPAESATESATESAGELPPTDRLFRDPGILGQGTQLALIATAAISVAMVVAHIVLNNRLTDNATNGESIVKVESVHSIIGNWLRWVLIVALVVTYLLTVVWGRRVVANLAVFGKPMPEAALWMWAIPLVNILVVHRHFDDAWKGSDVLLKDDPGWQKTRGNWWTLGFAAFAIAAVGVLFYGSTRNGDLVEAAIDSNAFLMIGYALLGAAVLCLVRSISGIIERQHNRARHFI